MLWEAKSETQWLVPLSDGGVPANGRRLCLAGLTYDRGRWRG